MNEDTNPNHYIRAKMNGLYTMLVETNRQIDMLRDICSHPVTKQREIAKGKFEQSCVYCDKHLTITSDH
jgi:nitrite reductase/ring-hydroxylating ferredoxin subunit